MLDTVPDAVGLEVIFADDSLNGTAERIREIYRRGRRVCCLQRIGRLASPRLASKGLRQHPPHTSPLLMPTCITRNLLPQMLAVMKSGPVDFGGILDGKGAGAPSKTSRCSIKKPLTGSAPSALQMAGSEHVTGGGIGGWVGRSRAKMSAVTAGPSRIREASPWIS